MSIPATPKAAARSGIVAFAAVLLTLAGAFNLIDGIAAVADDQRFAVDELLFGNLTSWGVVWIVMGAFQLTVAYLIFAGRPAGAVIGITVVLFNAVLHLMFIGVYPAWSIAILVVDGLVIWALSTHPAFDER